MILLKENQYDLNQLFESFHFDTESIFESIGQMDHTVYSLNETKNDRNIIVKIVDTLVKWVSKIKDFVVKFVSTIVRIVTNFINGTKLRRMKEKIKDMPLGYEKEFYDYADDLFAKGTYRDVKKSIVVLNNLEMMTSVNFKHLRVGSITDDIYRIMAEKLAKSRFTKDEAEDLILYGKRPRKSIIDTYYDEMVPEIRIDHKYMGASDCVVLMEQLVDFSKKLNTRVKADLDKQVKDLTEFAKKADTDELSQLSKYANAIIQYNTFIVEAKSSILKNTINDIVKIDRVYTVALKATGGGNETS